MAWYLVSVLVGLIIGLIISRYLPAMVQFKGRIKQKGRNNNLSVKPDIKVKKRRLFKRKR